MSFYRCSQTNLREVALLSGSLDLSLSWGFYAEYKKEVKSLDGEVTSSIVACHL